MSQSIKPILDFLGYNPLRPAKTLAEKLGASLEDSEFISGKASYEIRGGGKHRGGPGCRDVGPWRPSKTSSNDVAQESLVDSAIWLSKGAEVPRIEEGGSGLNTTASFSKLLTSQGLAPLISLRDTEVRSQEPES